MSKKFPLFMNVVVILAFAPIIFIALVGGLNVIGKKDYTVEQESKSERMTASKYYEKDYVVEKYREIVVFDENKEGKAESEIVEKQKMGNVSTSSTKKDIENDEEKNVIKEETIKEEQLALDPIILGECNPDEVPVILDPGDELFMHNVSDFMPIDNTGAIELKYKTDGGNVLLKREYRSNISWPSYTTTYDITASEDIVTEAEFGHKVQHWTSNGDHDLYLINDNPSGGAKIYIYYADVEGIFDVDQWPNPTPWREHHYTWGCKDYEEVYGSFVHLTYDGSEESAGFFKGYNQREVTVDPNDTYVFSAYILPVTVEAGSEIELCTQYWTAGVKHIKGETVCSGPLDLQGITEWTRFEVRDDDIPSNAFNPRSYVTFSGAPSEIYLNTASYVNETDDSLNLWGKWGSFEDPGSLEMNESNMHGWFTWSAQASGGYNNSNSLTAELVDRIVPVVAPDVVTTEYASHKFDITLAAGQSFKPNTSGKLDYVEFCSLYDQNPVAFKVREGGSFDGDEKGSTSNIVMTNRRCDSAQHNFDGNWFRVDFSEENILLDATSQYMLTFNEDENSSWRLLFDAGNPYAGGRMRVQGEEWYYGNDMLIKTYMIAND